MGAVTSFGEQTMIYAQSLAKEGRVNPQVRVSLWLTAVCRRRRTDNWCVLSVGTNAARCGVNVWMCVCVCV